MSTADSHLSRRTLLRATSATAAATTATAALASRASAAPAAAPAVPSAAAALFAQLDTKIKAGMAKYAIPGAAVGVLYQGIEYVKGYGVTNVDYPTPVDGDTVFRIGSTTKTFTGTTAMRLVDAGLLDLDAPLRRYLPDFRTADPTVADRATVRELFNHTAGWLGDDFLDTGPGDDAAARFAAGLSSDPQLTPPGTVFAYNNAALEVAGRIIEIVTGASYETAVRQLVIDPLGLSHTRFYPDDVIGFNVAASHNNVDGKAVVAVDFYPIWRSIDAAGAIISSARDQLRWARFHLGDGTVPGGTTRLLSQQSLLAMRSNPGPGGTLFVELDGVGVTWLLRPSAEGVRIVQHGGDWNGQHSGFLMVPDRGFAITLLTNSESGPNLVDELFADDWALQRFAGISNLPAVPLSLSPAELAPYQGEYVEQEILPDGTLVGVPIELSAVDGYLLATVGGTPYVRLVFYRPDFVLIQGPDGEPMPIRANFVRGASGSVDWLRFGGRLLGHTSSPGATSPSAPARVPQGARAAGPLAEGRHPYWVRPHGG